jgi:hypothetical protein
VEKKTRQTGQVRTDTSGHSLKKLPEKGKTSPDIEAWWHPKVHLKLLDPKTQKKKDG